MFNAIPATTALGIANPMTQQTGLANVSQNIRTNNQEQLEARSVANLKEARQGRHLQDREEEEDQEAPEDHRDAPDHRRSTLETIFKERQRQANDREKKHTATPFLRDVATTTPQTSGKTADPHFDTRRPPPASPHHLLDIIA
ncbi:MAG: hypothetical protein HQL76_09480 [Magnetococcales bacterium]|nr:hypothetical protein [Magnetococcales bacterium]